MSLPPTRLPAGINAPVPNYDTDAAESPHSIYE